VKLHIIEIANLIFNNLETNKEALKSQFSQLKQRIGYFYLDALLTAILALEIHQKVPITSKAILKKNIREFKFTAVQMNTYDFLLGAIIFAFQEKKWIAVISGICEIKKLCGDENLYAGGLSLIENIIF
jgi:hypothetical protein